MRIFLAADNEDREGRANAKTVRLFQVASQFMEVMRIFSGAADGAGLPEIEERLKYARWRAIEISKTLGENSLVKNHSVSENSALPSMSGNFSAKRPLDPMVEPVDSRLVQLKNNNSDSHLEPSKNQEVLSSWPSNTNYGNPYPPTTSSIDGHVKQNSNDLGTKDQTMSSKSTDNYDYNRFDSNPVAIVSERIVSQAPADESVMRDPEPLSLAEKHARFAISALLFEDVPNAILNLEKALSILRNTK